MSRNVYAEPCTAAAHGIVYDDGRGKKTYNDAEKLLVEGFDAHSDLVPQGWTGTWDEDYGELVGLDKYTNEEGREVYVVNESPYASVSVYSMTVFSNEETSEPVFDFFGSTWSERQTERQGPQPISSPTNPINKHAQAVVEYTRVYERS